MRLADLRLAVRPRRPLEAMDLGVRLAQAEAGALWRSWFLLTLPLLLVGIALTLATDSGVAALLLWWLKPLYDMGLLLLLSRRVFGDAPGNAGLLRLLAGSWRHGLPGHLLWRRFSMSRAFLLPAWLLEGLPARERQARLALLRQQYTGRARWLHLVMVHAELMLMLALLSLLFWLAPKGTVPELWQLLSDEAGTASQLATLLAYYGAMTIVEPFYVAAGFSLYLNRRTELEAWDLELAFRHLRERLDAAGEET